VSAVFYHGTEVPSYLVGEYRVSEIPSGVGGTVSRELHLRTYPNPFNPSVHISFVNPAREFVSATIHDAAGRRVATLIARVMDAGDQTLEWDGRDVSAQPSSSGVYFLRLRAGSLRANTKLVLLR
jgi:FlgD Ig-like domain